MTSALAIQAMTWRDKYERPGLQERDASRRDGVELLREDGRSRRPRVFFRGGAVLRTWRWSRVWPVGRPIPIPRTAIAIAIVTVAATQRSTSTSSPWTPTRRASKRRVIIFGPGSPDRKHRTIAFRDRRDFEFTANSLLRIFEFGSTYRERRVHALLRVINCHCVCIPRINAKAILVHPCYRHVYLFRDFIFAFHA